MKDAFQNQVPLLQDTRHSTRETFGLAERLFSLENIKEMENIFLIEGCFPKKSCTVPAKNPIGVTCD